MNQPEQTGNPGKNTDKDNDQSLPNRIARTVDPPSRVPSDDELRDPGSAHPEKGPADNRS